MVLPKSKSKDYVADIYDEEVFNGVFTVNIDAPIHHSRRCYRAQNTKRI